ncbi:MAG: transporter substrate-binding protein, partial [Microcoleaceae cyanobacterium]
MTSSPFDHDYQGDRNTEPGLTVGILHSLTGTMAISEVGVKDATLMAIAEINTRGGLLGQEIRPLVVDGASDPGEFTRQARLLGENHIAHIFGCWTSGCRKAVLPVLKEYHQLLWYPVQYEGLESSTDVFYGGLCPNQQVVTAIDWLLSQNYHKFYLLGSDYVFPKTVNKLIKALL